jgi:hypothetical protein
MPSFDAVNYAIRPNKAVERKIVFSALAKVSRIVDLSAYRYIGLGSLWFVDFLMAHKILGVKSMVSIEASKIGFQRAEFNRPLACIDVIEGVSTAVLQELDLKQSASLVWFDYDSSIGGPVLQDIELLAPRCAANSIIILTVNAKKDQLPKRNAQGEEISEETSLRQIAGDLLPDPLERNRLQPINYPKLICEILGTALQNATTESGRKESFVKLFDIVYSDATPMSTVGGIIAADDKAEAFRQLVAEPDWGGIVDKPIAIPPLTMKEKMALDRLMPSEASPTDLQMTDIGFQLRRDQIDAYHRHYLHYPMFGEFLL